MSNKILSLLLGGALLLLSACQSEKTSEPDYDIVIYGATSAGAMAAYSAKMMGKSVLLLESSTHIGGLTSGGLGYTDIGNKYAITGLARDFYRKVGEEYDEFESWIFEPKVASAVYDDYLAKAEVEVLLQKQLVSAEKEGAVIRSITVQDAETSEEMTVSGKQFIDATYEGDLLAKAGVSFTVGRESNETYGETYNGVQLLEKHQFPDGIDPYIVPGDSTSGLLWGISDAELAPRGSADDKVQAYNFRICLSSDPDNRIPITRPADYDSARYELLARLIATKPNATGLYTYLKFDRMPNNKTDINNNGAFSTDMIGMNYHYPEASYEERAEFYDELESYTKGLLYFLWHDERVPEELRQKLNEWGYPKDEYVDNGNWSPQIYVREGRRMIGEYVMTEHNCVGREVVDDPIALAAYTMDSHNCQRLVVDGMVKNEGDVQIGGFPPYPISYRSLTPKREECENLLVPVSLSASHIAFGSIRMEPVFMVLGQVTAVAASMAIDAGAKVQEIDVSALQQKLENDPLLDGTPADVLVDDANDQQVERVGDWNTDAPSVRSYGASTSEVERTDEHSFRFLLPVKQSGSYKAYYYCPVKRGQEAVYPESLSVHVQAGGNTTTQAIDYAENAGEWAYLGTYNFDADQPAYIELDGAASVGQTLLADAVLLVWEENSDGF